MLFEMSNLDYNLISLLLKIDYIIVLIIMSQEFLALYVIVMDVDELIL